MFYNCYCTFNLFLCHISLMSYQDLAITFLSSLTMLGIAKSNNKGSQKQKWHEFCLFMAFLSFFFSFLSLAGLSEKRQFIFDTSPFIKIFKIQLRSTYHKTKGWYSWHCIVCAYTYTCSFESASDFLQLVGLDDLHIVFMLEAFWLYEADSHIDCLASRG